MSTQTRIAMTETNTRGGSRENPRRGGRAVRPVRLRHKSARVRQNGRGYRRAGDRRFGCAEGLRESCCDYIVESIPTLKLRSLQSMSPATWFAQIRQIESFAPMMTYLSRSMEFGGARTLADAANRRQRPGFTWRTAVRAGIIKPSRDPKACGRFLSFNGGGGFLLYLHMNDNPIDRAAVLRDYGRQVSCSHWSSTPMG